jgi:hypothetical protein
MYRSTIYQIHYKNTPTPDMEEIRNKEQYTTKQRMSIGFRSSLPRNRTTVPPDIRPHPKPMLIQCI